MRNKLASHLIAYFGAIIKKDNLNGETVLTYTNVQKSSNTVHMDMKISSPTFVPMAQFLI